MSGFAVYQAAEVRKRLDFPGCIEAVREAMTSLSTEAQAQPLRSIATVAPGKFFGLMPGVGTPALGFGAKLVSVFPNPARAGRSRHQGVVLVFDSDDGRPLCVADADEITRIRTACASAAATDALARPDAATMAVFGCGTQADSHVRAIPLVRQLENILVWGRSAPDAREFAARMREETGYPVSALADAREAAQAADIICTVTSSAEPVLWRDWVRPGTHINAVGSSVAGPCEIDTALVAASRYFVDYRPSALAAAAEFLNAREQGLIDDSHILAEIGAVFAGAAAGRESGQEITMYKSLGHIFQDLAAAGYVHERALEAATGGA